MKDGKIMRRVGYVGLGAIAGFVVALGLLSTALGEPDTLSVYRQLDLFGSAYEKVRDNYVTEVKDADLIDAAITGMVSSLDPHSNYYNAKNYPEMSVQTNGEYGGVGLTIVRDDGMIKVISPMEESPAARAGIKAGDYITRINGHTLTNDTLNDVADKMRGPTGTQVTLSVLHKGKIQPSDVTLTRSNIEVHKVKYRREGNIGYIHMSFFDKLTATGFETAVRALKSMIGPSLKGYVLDLRDNPGGLVDQAVAVSDDMMNSGEIVTMRGRHVEATERYDAKAGDIMDGKPLAVLINEGSASASEIVVGALQDHKRATVIGMTSFGKGSFQAVIPLDDGKRALLLTTGRYYTPSGRSIQATGIEPDIAVAQAATNEKDAKTLRLIYEADLPRHLEGAMEGKHVPKSPIIVPLAGKKYDDFQLTYALDYLNGRPTPGTTESRVSVARTEQNNKDSN